MPPRTGYRAGVDRDGDFALDGDERDEGTDPADPTSTPTTGLMDAGPMPMDMGVDQGSDPADMGNGAADMGAGGGSGGGGCGCRVGGRGTPDTPAAALSLLVLGLAWRRRRGRLSLRG